MSSEIHVTGWGAVSPAGWTAESLQFASYGSRALIDPEPWQRTPESQRMFLRRVPELPADLKSLVANPRLRRAPAVTKFAAAAAMEALGPERLAQSRQNTLDLRLGIVFGLLNGCVSYSRKFYMEVLENPSHASPILFPETVFNSPSSHLSAVLGITGPNDTLVGDSAQFVTALDHGVFWLEQGEIDACLVVCAEEIDWPCVEAMALRYPETVMSEGAAAILIERVDSQNAMKNAGEGNRLPVRLEQITERHLMNVGAGDRLQAAQRMHQELPTFNANDLLVDSQQSKWNHDLPEHEIWKDWSGVRLSPGRIYGESYSVLGAWQTVLAAQAISEGLHPRAVISCVGSSEKAGAIVLQNASIEQLKTP